MLLSCTGKVSDLRDSGSTTGGRFGDEAAAARRQVAAGSATGGRRFPQRAAVSATGGRLRNGAAAEVRAKPVAAEVSATGGGGFRNGAGGAGTGGGRHRDRRRPPRPASRSPPTRHYFKDQFRARADSWSASHTWNNLQDWGENHRRRPFDFPGYVSFPRRAWPELHAALAHRAADVLRACRPTPAPRSSPRRHPWLRTGPGTAFRDGPPRLRPLGSSTRRGSPAWRRYRVSQLNAGPAFGSASTSSPANGSTRSAAPTTAFPFSAGNKRQQHRRSRRQRLDVDERRPNANHPPLQTAFIDKTVDNARRPCPTCCGSSPRRPGGKHHLVAHVT